VQPVTLRAAAIQIEAQLGDIAANLELCEREIERAASAGASWIVLPEFFSTGVANLPRLRELAPPRDGAPTQLLSDLARRHGAHVGGSTLVRDSVGDVRNAFLLAGPDGRIVGRHDKDIPTMWENALYVGGRDPGLISLNDLTIGVALCWELMRTQTARRLAGRVDLVVGGSGWWSIPSWPPRRFWRRLEDRNRRRAVDAAARFAPYVGAPVVHAAHSGRLDCPLPLIPIRYRGRFEGGASICDVDSTVLAMRTREEGPGFAIADVQPGRAAAKPLSRGYWLQPRGAVAAASWRYQNAHGRRVYQRARRQPPGTAT
jgi:predicted amidohydrolase